MSCSRRSLQLAALALVLAVLLWCAGPAHGQPVVGDVPIISTTVASLPASSTIPRLVVDGASSSDCTTGGGSTFVWCYWNGSAWAAFGDGGGAGGAGDVTAVGDCATGDCFQATTARHAFLSPVAGGVATFRSITEADVSDLAHTVDTDTTCLDAGVDCLFAASATEGGAATSVTEGAVTAHEAALTITEAQISDLGAYLMNIVEDTTPQIGGDLDAQGNAITGLGDVTFQTGASGGTLRTGTSAADLFKLQAYDVDGGAYLDMLELDAGNTPVMSLLHVTEIDLDAGGVIRTGTAAGDTALIQARDVDGAAWTTFATLTANDTPTFDLAASTTVGGATIQTGVDDTGTDTLDDLSDDDLGALQNVTETGEGAGIPLVGDGTGGWAPAAATGCLSNGTNCPADDDVPEAADYSNLTGGTAITNSPTGTINLDTTASPAITGDWDFGGGGIEIENGTTPPACTPGQLYQDTDATSGQQLMACEAGTFVLQGDGGGGGSSSSGTGLQYGDGAGGFSEVTSSSVSGADVTLGGVLAIPVGAVGAPSIAFAGDLDTGIYQATANRLRVVAGGALAAEFLSATNFGVMADYHRAPAAGGAQVLMKAGGLSLSTASSVGWTAGNADSSVDTTITRVGVNALAISGAVVNAPSAQTCTEDGTGAAGALSLSVSGVSYVALTNLDSAGCVVTLSETGATNGQRLEIVVVSNAGGTVDFSDTAGVSEMAGAFSADSWDAVTFRYATDRFVEISRSNN